MKNSNVLLLGSVLLIVLAIVVVAVIDRNGSGSGSDIRARAGQVFTLKLTGVVNSIDETAGTITVSSVQFDSESRSGEAKDLGEWLITPPADFNYASVSPGTPVLIGVDAKTFQVTSHKLTAVTLVPAAR